MEGGSLVVCGDLLMSVCVCVRERKGFVRSLGVGGYINVGVSRCCRGDLIGGWGLGVVGMVGE